MSVALAMAAGACTGGGAPTWTFPPAWSWDWGLGGPDKMRLYLLSARGGAVAIIVDSCEGTTFDELTHRASAILATVNSTEVGREGREANAYREAG